MSRAFSGLAENKLIAPPGFDELLAESLSPCLRSRWTGLYVVGYDRFGVDPADGSLSIQDFGWVDRGQYTCLVASQGGGLAGNATESLELDPDYRTEVYHFSLVYGFSTAAGFLLITLLAKLIYYLLET